MVMKAAMMGANALSGVICQERGTDWKRNCWQTVVCVAEAIAITDEAVLGVGSQHGGGNAQSGRGVPAVAAGSGFFVSTDGFVVTSQHVIEGASKVRVILSDGRRLDADVVASSRATDLAILKVSSASPGMLSLASSRSAKVGQWVFTYGYPVTDVLGSEPKFSDGSISSLSGLRDEHSFMQISVPVQPGNSGGPLVNEKGQVVGVIAAQAAVSRFYEATGTLPQNVNWAVKAEYVALLAELSQAQGETGSRQEAIDRVRRAICRIETEH
jgi:S1-C subfamily serine protease